MSENARPSVAIRIVRPYETEAELLDHELETIGKTSVVLIGAHPRPSGVILRFEVLLASGAVVLRGEGRVLAHKENAYRGQPGLTLRFTRLDPKSKALVDRATFIREAGPHDSGSPSRPFPPPESPIADALTASTPPSPRVAPSGRVPSAAPVALKAPDAPDAPDASPVVDQGAAVASALALAREKANMAARANARRTGPPGGLTPPPAPTMPPQRARLHAGASSRDSGPAPAPTPSRTATLVSTATLARTATPVTVVPGAVEVEAETSRYSALPGRTPPPTPMVDGVTARTLGSPPLADDPRARRPAKVAPAEPAAAIEAPRDRAQLLERLRERAARLPRARVEEILAARAARG